MPRMIAAASTAVVTLAPAGPAGMSIDPSSGRVFVGNQGAGVVTTLSPRR